MLHVAGVEGSCSDTLHRFSLVFIAGQDDPACGRDRAESGGCCLAATGEAATRGEILLITLQSA